MLLKMLSINIIFHPVIFGIVVRLGFLVTLQNEVAYKVTCKSRREDITLAVANATRCILDLVIIFTGKIFKVHVRDHALTNIFYTVSESG